MAKRVLMIAPFEALRGNVSGKQKLLYAENDNPAYEAPDGVNYARNYKPRYVVSMNSKTGNVHFGLKRKHAIVNNALTRKTMGALGATQDLYRKAAKDLSIIGTMLNAYRASAEYANGESMYKWFAKTADKAFRQKYAAISFIETKDGHDYTLTIDNPFIEGTTGSVVEMSPAIIQKFFTSLCGDTGFEIVVGGYPIIGFLNMTWGDVAEDDQLNVSNVTTVTSGGQTYVKIGNMFVMYAHALTPDEREYVHATDAIGTTEASLYFLTDVSPIG